MIKGICMNNMSSQNTALNTCIEFTTAQYYQLPTCSWNVPKSLLNNNKS